jgi:hypothetical protein
MTNEVDAATFAAYFLLSMDTCAVPKEYLKQFMFYIYKIRANVSTTPTHETQKVTVEHR